MFGRVVFFILESSPGDAQHAIGRREWRWIRKGGDGLLQVCVPALRDYTLLIYIAHKLPVPTTCGFDFQLVRRLKNEPTSLIWAASVQCFMLIANEVR